MVETGSYLNIGHSDIALELIRSAAVAPERPKLLDHVRGAIEKELGKMAVVSKHLTFVHR